MIYFLFCLWTMTCHCVTQTFVTFVMFHKCLFVSFLTSLLYLLEYKTRGLCSTEGHIHEIFLHLSSSP